MTPREKLRHEVGRWLDKKVQAQIEKNGGDRCKAALNLRKQGMDARLAALLVASRSEDRTAPPYLICYGCRSQVPRPVCPSCGNRDLRPLLSSAQI